MTDMYCVLSQPIWDMDLLFCYGRGPAASVIFALDLDLRSDSDLLHLFHFISFTYLFPSSLSTSWSRGYRYTMATISNIPGKRWVPFPL